jgi:hypothetical protein
VQGFLIHFLIVSGKGDEAPAVFGQVRSLRDSITIFIYFERRDAMPLPPTLDISRLCGMVSAFSETLNRVGLIALRAVTAEAMFLL